MYKLTNSLPYMLNMIAARLGEAFSAELAEHRLTLPMFRVLAALLQREEQRSGELSQMIEMGCVDAIPVGGNDENPTPGLAPTPRE